MRIGEAESIVLLVTVQPVDGKPILSREEKRAVRTLLGEAWKMILQQEGIGAFMSMQNGKRKEANTFARSAIDNLQEFLDAADRGESITARRVKLNLEPRDYTPQEVRMTREKLRLSQAVFAQFMGVSSKAVEAWESGANPPPGPVCRTLEAINLNPRAFFQMHLCASATRNTRKVKLREIAGR